MEKNGLRPNLAGPTRLSLSRVRTMSLDSERDVSGPAPMNQSSSPAPPSSRAAPGLRFILVVFAVIAIAISTSFGVFWLLPRQQPLPTNIVFADPVFVQGNVSLTVQSVIRGPYSSSGFHVNLAVNNFAGQSTPLGANGSVVRISIGPNTYRVSWQDRDGDGSVSPGDTFTISGDRVPLPPLSVYEFDLQWPNAWTAHAFWSTD